ncbi:hypothetical protein MNBD_PLANCTO03-2220, partial [hydrothermal vent metagenome]
MGCTSNNATPHAPAIAPGAEDIDPAAVAERLVRQHGPGGMHPRIRELVPGFDAPFFQAGLAGYSDAAMRIIARRHGCPYCVTEALLDRTILAGGRGFAKADLGELHDNVPGGREDRPLAGQLMGSDPAELAIAALKMVEQGARSAKEYRHLAYGGRIPGGHLRLPGGEQLGRIDSAECLKQSPQRKQGACSKPVSIPTLARALGSDNPTPSFAAIDINLACPVKKISRKARGGHWLAEPRGAIALLEAVREAVPSEIPCTLKIRRSFDDTPEMVENFWTIFEAAYDMGYAWATIHARTVEQKYVGPSRWDLLRDIVQRARRADPDRPIFGSGDIWTASDIFRMIDYTGVTGASVARGCIGNPWIFRQARQLLAGETPAPPTIAEQRSVLEEHFELALAVNAGMRSAESFTGRTMRKFGIRFAEHHPQSEEVRQRFIKVKSLDEWRGVLEEF